MKIDRRLPAELDDEVRRRELVDVRRGDVVPSSGTVEPWQHNDRRSRPIPVNAYVRPGLGDLPLSAQLRASLRLLTDTLLPLVDSIEAQTPQPLLCIICRRNLGGWPVRVLEDHWNGHSWLQRQLARIRLTG